ncbi:hypothetical protein DRQ53_09595 [bacterium]|nr:MAG: hypothetical protein DRQ53_09595 [bacterium]
MRTLIILVLLAIPATALAGSLADALQADEANLYFSFQTREGVYGDGESLSINLDGSRSFGRSTRPSWGREMTEGPGRVWIRIRDGRIRDIDLEVGGKEPRLDSKRTDLGFIDAAEVRDVMLTIAETSRDDEAEDAIICAVVSDGFAHWDRLLAIARDQKRPDDVRESAIFWLGQEASATATAGLEQIVDDEDDELEIREHAIFALSQQGIDRSFDSLRRIALESAHPQLRETAFFWLAQEDDPRVVDLFEEVLVE